MEKEQPKAEKTQWHKWFGNLFKISLTPLGVEVLTEYPVMKDPPEADVIIIRKHQPEWTPEQLKYLPDGIRDCSAAHIILEFKYTESVNEIALCKTLGYWVFYKIHNNLKDDELQAFLISSKTPADATLKQFGYALKEYPGFYRSEYQLLKRIPLLSLNDLADEPYNAFVKLFAAKKKEMLSAVTVLINKGFVFLPDKMKSYLGNFLKILFKIKENMIMDEMEKEFNPEELRQIINTMATMLPPEMVIDDILSKFKPDEILSRYGKEERLAGLTPDDILAKFRPDEILSRYGKEERLAGLTPDDILSRFKPDEILARYGKEERLAGLTPDEIETYLKKLREKDVS